LGGAQHLHHSGVRGLRRYPDAVDAGEPSRPDPRRERQADVADAICLGEVGVYTVSLREIGFGGYQQGKPPQREQLPDDVQRPYAQESSQESSVCHTRIMGLDLGGVWRGIAAAQWPSEGAPASGHRHERRLQQRLATTSGKLGWRADKFHVIQNVVEACGHVRKAESRADTGKRDRLELTLWM